MSKLRSPKQLSSKVLQRVRYGSPCGKRDQSLITLVIQMSKNLAQKTRKTGIIASALMIPLVFMIFSPSMITSHATTPTLVTGVATATDQVTTVIGASGKDRKS